MRPLLLPFVVAIAACGSEGAARDTLFDHDAPTALDGPLSRADGKWDGGGDLVDTGPIFVDSCSALPSHCANDPSPDCGKCQYRIMHDRRCSKEQPCDNLLLYWANYGCEAEGWIQTARVWVETAPDFVVACVQPLYPGEILPSSLGAPEREQAVVPVVLDRVGARGDLGVWSGKNLLMGGCSAGGSRYPVVAARYDADDDWLGSDKTAVCMSDGVVNVPEQDRFVGEGVSMGGQSCAGRHARVVSAYTREEPQSGHACSTSPAGQCACDPDHASISYPEDCGGGSCVEFDTIITRGAGADFAFSPGVSASSFAVQSWRLITEGSAFEDTSERCEKDVAPRDPYQALCTALEADPQHRCDYLDRPSMAHCAFYGANFVTVCIDWFRTL